MKDAGISELLHSRPWFHSFEILPGVFTPGRVKIDAKLALDLVGVPAHLSGKLVLDVGALDGAYSFEMERRGASVFALDIQDPDRTGFNVAKGVLNSSVKYVKGTVYDLAHLVPGPFDAILFFGVYYHLKKPLQALEQIWKVLEPSGRLYFEGAILDYADHVDSFWKPRARSLKELRSLPVAYFTSGDYAADRSNWFIPTQACLAQWLEATGFRDVEMATPLDELNSRTAGSAVKDPAFQPYEHGLV